MTQANNPPRGRFTLPLPVADNGADEHSALRVLNRRYFDYLVGIPYAREQAAGLGGLKPLTDTERTLQQRADSLMRQGVPLQLEDPERLTVQYLSLSTAQMQAVGQLLLGDSDGLTRQVLQYSWLARELGSLTAHSDFRRMAGLQEELLPTELCQQPLLTLTDLLRYLFKRMCNADANLYPLLGRKLWQASHLTAAVAAYLATDKGLDPHKAYCLGLLKQLGVVVACRVMHRVFEEMRVHNLEKAKMSQARPLIQLFEQFQPPADAVRAVLNQHLQPLQQRLLAHWQWHSPWLGALDESVAAMPPQLCSPYARLLFEAQIVSRYLQLSETRLLPIEAAVNCLQQVAVDSDKLNKIQSANLKKWVPEGLRTRA